MLPPVDTNEIDESSESIEELAIQVREKMLKTLKEISIPNPQLLTTPPASPSLLSTTASSASSSSTPSS